MRKRAGKEEKQDGSRWLTTYSDMMNNLLVLFIMLYAISMVDQAKFEKLKEELSNALNPIEIIEEYLSPTQVQQMIIEESIEDLPDEFDAIYEILKKEISDNGYERSISIERNTDYIRLRFGDNVLFFPDSPKIKPESNTILNVIGTILKSVEHLTKNIEIGGHTATVGTPNSSYFAWELSVARAVSVLKFMVGQCQIDESIISIAGYSKFQPIGDNNTEEGRMVNRRVEVKITRLPKNPSSQASK